MTKTVFQNQFLWKICGLWDLSSLTPPGSYILIYRWGFFGEVFLSNLWPLLLFYRSWGKCTLYFWFFRKSKISCSHQREGLSSRAGKWCNPGPRGQQQGSKLQSQVVQEEGSSKFQQRWPSFFLSISRELPDAPRGRRTIKISQLIARSSMIFLSNWTAISMAGLHLILQLSFGCWAAI